MTWVKICGITNLEDALTAVEAGADALGFVFYEKSPRNITPETVSEIVLKLPRNLEKVGVFVGESAEYINEIVRKAGLTAAQLLADASPMGQTVQEPGFPHGSKMYVVLPASLLLGDHGRFRAFGWNRESKDVISAVFIDAGTPEQPGGTGRTFDWHQAVHAADLIKRSGFDLVVAGGLTPGNVTQAIEILKPWGVDVSSGVESKPGKKDPEKVRAFVAAVRQTERLV
jgi:phosphoribosylanthranilate isomerase